LFLIDDLLFAPIDGFKFILNTISKVAQEQYTDDAPVKEQLLELQVLLDNGDITEDQYVEREASILRQLRDIENRKREMAGLAPEEGRGPMSGKVTGEATVNLSFGERRDDQQR
jgi:hypothetical protein